MKTTDDFFEARKGEPDWENYASNAIRDMFQSQHYKGKVPVKDIEHMLGSSRWHKIYGKKHLRAAWKSLQGDFVKKKGDHWVWTLGYMH